MTAPAEHASLAARPLEAAILFYQRFISPLTPPTCRFYPSCSSYGLTAVRRYGPLRGSWLVARRLCRCHPWTAGGVDHVPPRDERGRPDWAAQRRDTARRESARDGVRDDES